LILKFFIIAPGGILCCSKDFLGEEEEDKDNYEDITIGGFLTAFQDWAHEIKGGSIKAIDLGNFNFIYSYSAEYDYTFVIVIDKDDSEVEARSLVKMMKNEFIEKYKSILPNWNNDTSVFDGFCDYMEDNIYIPPKILITGEENVGKTTIMDLFPGETLLELDDDMNVIQQKRIELEDKFIFKECVIKEIDINTLTENFRAFNDLLKSLDIVLFTTNSAASNLGRLQESIAKVKLRTSKADFYIIANFQDLIETAFKPEEIENTFKIKTFGFSTKKVDKESEIIEILKVTLDNLLKR
jgi:hypothetical protein